MAKMFQVHTDNLSLFAELDKGIPIESLNQFESSLLGLEIPIETIMPCFNHTNIISFTGGRILK